MVWLLPFSNRLSADWNTAVSNSNPLNWYRLDEPKGSTAIDYGSEELHGTYGMGVNAPTRGASGLVGTGVTFDGERDTIFLGGSDLSGDWSAEFIVKKNMLSGRSAILVRGIPFQFPSTALKLEQHESAGEVGYTQFGAADFVFTPAVEATVGEFVHLVFVKDSSSVDAYVNGVLAGTRTNPIALSRYQLGDESGESPFAVLDEVVIYNRALSPAEIAQHFLAILGGAIANEFDIIRGFQIDGDLSDTYFSDNSYLRFQPGFTLFSGEPPLQITFDSTVLTNDFQTLTFNLEAAANTLVLTQSIDLFNYDIGGYEPVDSRTANLTDTVVKIAPDGDSSRFVQPGTGNVKARLSWAAAGPILRFPWTVRIDRVLWTISQD